MWLAKFLDEVFLGLYVKWWPFGYFIFIIVCLETTKHMTLIFMDNQFFSPVYFITLIRNISALYFIENHYFLSTSTCF